MLTNVMWYSVVTPFYFSAMLFLCVCIFAITKERIPLKKIKMLKYSFTAASAICICFFVIQFIAKMYFFEKIVESIESKQSTILIDGRDCNLVCRGDLSESFKKRKMFKMKGSSPTSATKLDISDDFFKVSLLLMADSKTESLYSVYLYGKPSFVIAYIKTSF